MSPAIPFLLKSSGETYAHASGDMHKNAYNSKYEGQLNL